MIKAVFFDAGNTILAPNPSFEQVAFEVFDRLGLKYDRSSVILSLPYLDDLYNRYYWENLRFWNDPGTAAVAWASIYGDWLESLELGPVSRYFGWELYREFGRAHRWRVFDDVPAGIEALRKRGLKLGVVSNWDHRLEDIMFNMGLLPYFDFIVSSACEKAYKPDKEIFHIACAKTGVEPEEVIFVGDHWLADILGARNAGLKPVYINRQNHFHLLDCPEIKSLEELLQFL